MFLDKRLIKMCENFDLENVKFEDIKALINGKILNECDNEWKQHVKPGLKKPDLAIIIRRVCNSYDLFVKNAVKSDNFKIKDLGRFFSNISYRDLLYKDEFIKKIVTEY